MGVRGWDAGHHPGVVLTEKREQFARLIGQGVSNSEACRLVGVNHRTETPQHLDLPSAQRDRW
jgi:hypothetical protein